MHTREPFARKFVAAGSALKRDARFANPTSTMVQLVRAAAIVDAETRFIENFRVPPTFVGRSPAAIAARRKSALAKRAGKSKKLTRGKSKRAGRR